MKLTNKQKGELGEILVSMELIKRGLDVVNLNTVNRNYKNADLICMNANNGKSVMIQVKSGTTHNILTGYISEVDGTIPNLETSVIGPWVFVYMPDDKISNMEFYIQTREEVIEVAKLTHAHDFIMRTEKGYDSQVGEGGDLLSTGEKQLISFARAIIANPKILILDEATSSIDTQTEYVIQQAIKDILKGRTSFVVAHRLSTIVNSDLILVINDGKITEQGTHEQLMKLKGYYYKLFTNQFIEDKMKELNF